jgi:DNA-binding protein YbaB
MTRPAETPDWLQRAAAMRDGLANTASSMDTTEFTRSSGGVTLTMTASGTMLSVKVDPRLIKDPAALERDLIGAHRQVQDAIKAIAENMMAPLRNMVTQLNAEFGRAAQ